MGEVQTPIYEKIVAGDVTSGIAAQYQGHRRQITALTDHAQRNALFKILLERLVGQGLLVTSCVDDARSEVVDGDAVGAAEAEG